MIDNTDSDARQRELRDSDNGIKQISRPKKEENMEKTLLFELAKCPRCGSRDIRFRIQMKLHNLCRRCGYQWSRPGDDPYEQ